MGLQGTDECRQDAVRIALTTGRARKPVADDPGVGVLALNAWITAHGETGAISKEGSRLARANDRLRPENRTLEEEREIFEKATVFLGRQKP